MIIELLDVKEYANVDGKEFHFMCSFNMRNKVAHVWSNGWCPVSYFKVADDGNVYGRISNELVPTGVYNGVEVTTQDNTICNKVNRLVEAGA